VAISPQAFLEVKIILIPAFLGYYPSHVMLKKEISIC